MSDPEAEGRRSLRLAALVGAACAVAMTIKVSAVFLIPAIVLGRWLRRKTCSDTVRRGALPARPRPSNE